MKIIYIITGLATGGAERALYNLLNEGLAERFDCHVISLIDEGTIGPQIQALQVPVSSLGMRNGRPTVSSLLQLRRIVREFKPDVVQGWMYHGNLMARLARTLSPGRPALCWNIRQTLYGIGYEKKMTQMVIRANRFFSSSPDVLLYNSGLSRKQHEAFGFDSSNGQVIPNGIDMQMFSFSSAYRHQVRSELNIPDSALLVGHVARMHPMKDHSLLLRAASKLAVHYPDTHYLLIGKDITVQNKSLIRLIPDEVMARFHMLGERDDISRLMSAMDIFCLSSSRGEGFPNVIGEAMATGVPCLTTDVGDSGLIVDDTGVIVPPGNEHDYMTGLEKLLTMPVKQRRELGIRARARIEANFTLASIVNRYDALYENLVTGFNTH